MTEKKKLGRPRNPNPSPHRDGYCYVTVEWPGRGTIRTGQHRVVAFAEWGPDDQACFWCDRMLVWFGTGAEELIVDHVNHDRSDNTPENLVPSCLNCNGKRKRPRAEESSGG